MYLLMAEAEDEKGLGSIIVNAIVKAIFKVFAAIGKWLWDTFFVAVWNWIVVYSFHLCLFVSLACIIYFIVSKCQKAKNTAILSLLIYLGIQLLNTL